MNLALPEIVYGEIRNHEKLIKSIVGNRKAFLISDKNTTQCRELFKESILFQLPYIELEAGDSFKTINQVSTIWEFLNDYSASREDIIFLLGGGVVSDIGGFAAATYKRGIDFINIPTTLLAMVDASIGGKTGFNFSHFKNNIGTFSHPKKIFTDVHFLKTLPKPEFLSGMAEVFKHAIIGDSKLWNYLKEHNLQDLNHDYLITRSAELKTKIVQSDPEEKNIRKSLNLGHTIGHAIESYQIDVDSPTMHGFAIAKGIIIESFIAYKIGVTSKTVFLEIKSVLSNYFKGHLNFKIDLLKILTLVKGDKKNIKNKINFSLPVSIGKVLINQEIKEKELENLMKEFLEND